MTARLRQLVIAGHSGETAETLAGILGLGQPFKDPGVGEFGLDNAVYPIGDQFLEVVWPIADTAPAKRFLEKRGGEGGYMAIFETPDIEAVRSRAGGLKVRAVWTIDLEDISATHFHPADLGGAIVSVDQPRPAGEWRWGGPDWRRRSTPGQLTGAHLKADDPATMADKWASLLGRRVSGSGEDLSIKLDGGALEFEAASETSLAGFHLSMPGADKILERAVAAGAAASENKFEFAGVVFTLSPH